MAPEQLAGTPVATSDQYALGIMVYELLTGRTPFQGVLPHAIPYMQANTIPEPPSAVNPSLPSALDTVVLRALAKKPHDRFASVKEFASAFAAVLKPNVVQPPKGKQTPKVPASSQKSGADPLVNPGQKRHDKSSSANLPQIIEKMPSYVLMYFRLSGIVLIIDDIVSAAIGLLPYSSYIGLLPYSFYTRPTIISSINLITGITILLFSLGLPALHMKQQYESVRAMRGSMGLPALHMKQPYQTRWLGLSGVAALCTSYLLFAISDFLNIYPYQFDYPLFYVANALQVIGSVLLGIAIVRASTFPRWTGVLLIVSGIIFIGSFMIYFIPYIQFYIINNSATLSNCIAFIGCGCTLLRLKQGEG